MDNRLLTILEKEAEYEKSRKKKKQLLTLKKEKNLNYYSGWPRGKS